MGKVFFITKFRVIKDLRPENLDAVFIALKVGSIPFG